MQAESDSLPRSLRPLAGGAARRRQSLFIDLTCGDRERWLGRWLPLFACACSGCADFGWPGGAVGWVDPREAVCRFRRAWGGHARFAAGHGDPVFGSDPAFGFDVDQALRGRVAPTGLPFPVFADGVGITGSSRMSGV